MGRGGGATAPQNLGDLEFWAAREIWAKLIFNEVCMCVCVLLPFSFFGDIFYFKLK